MVQIIQPSPRAMQAGQIGQQIGTGLAKRLGLSEAEQAFSQAQGDPVKLATAMARLTAVSPELARGAGEIYKQLLARSQAGQYGAGIGEAPSTLSAPMSEANPDIQGEIGPAGVIPNSTDVVSNFPENRAIADRTEIILPKSMSSADISNASQAYLGELRPDLIPGTTEFGRVPTFNDLVKSDLAPEEEAQVRQKFSGYSPEVQDRIVERLREDTRRAFKDKMTSFEMDKNKQDAINLKWQTFKNNSQQNLVPYLTKYQTAGRSKAVEDFKNKYFQYGSNTNINLTPEMMHAQAINQLINDMNRLDQLQLMPDMPPIRNPADMKGYLNQYKEPYKDLIKEGFYETVKEDATIKGMGLEEMHETIWGDQTSPASLNRLSVFQAPKRYLKSKAIPGMAGIPQVTKKKLNPNYEKQKESYLNNISKQLTQIKPEDDLMLLRGAVLSAGGTEADFKEGLNLAQKKGLKLSPFQKSQLTEIATPRQMPLWQIFSDPSGTIRNWFNLIRGKR